jgi:hypothetical protein
MLELGHKKQVEINFANNLVMARIREEVDTSNNKAKEDRLVMTGLKSKDPIPLENRARIEWLKKIVTNLFEKLIPGFPGKIFYLSQGKQMDVYLPMVEVKLDRPENAMAIRKAFAIKRKEKTLPDGLDSLFVTNCVSLSTRVRIDILKAIARKLTNDKELAYVSGFISRPMMHIKKAGSNVPAKPLKSFTFIDSVSRFGNIVTPDDLKPAYERAGVAFKGQLGQNFVVLNESDQEQFQGLGSSKPWSGGRGGGAGRGDRGGGRAGGTSGKPRTDKYESNRGVKRFATDGERPSGKK